MEECHKHVVLLAPRLIENQSAFENHDKKAIKEELHNIIDRIQHLIHNTNTIVDLKKVINAKFPIAEIFREFYYVIHSYLVEPVCRKGDRDYANIIRKYLCANGAKNLVTLYHFIANIGIIEAGCTRIYLVDKTKKNTPVDIISDENIFIQNITNPSFRISKKAVKECIQHVAIKDMGLDKLLIARLLLSISKDFRTRVSYFCPIIYKNWTATSKARAAQHEQFEKYLGELISIIDSVTSKQRRQRS
jgi:hypothetical protein